MVCFVSDRSVARQFVKFLPYYRTGRFAFARAIRSAALDNLEYPALNCQIACRSSQLTDDGQA